MPFDPPAAGAPPGGDTKRVADPRRLLERLEQRHEELLTRIDELHDQVIAALNHAARPVSDELEAADPAA